MSGLEWVPASAAPHLLGLPVRVALHAWASPGTGSGSDVAGLAGRIEVAEIDPDLADTAAMTEAYGLPLEASVNCVVVAGKREGVERIAACADVNRTVRAALDVRKASFLPTDRAVELTGMEYGGITPIGLPTQWRLLVDRAAAEAEWVIIGSGIRGSKLRLPGEVLAALPGAEVVDGLGLLAQPMDTIDNTLQL